MKRTPAYDYAIIAMIAVITTGGIMAFIVGNNASAQVEPTDRFFQRDFCFEENDDLAGILYTNGQELSYDTGGCPVVSKVIHKWNELSNADKNTVTNRLAQADYRDVTAQVQASQ